MNCVEYRGYEFLRNIFYKKGLSAPRLQTVANMAIYVGINSGYSEVDLYGADHTFLDSLCVNDKNQLCNRDKHFYDNAAVELKPIIMGDGKVWKIANYLEAISYMFKSHDLLEKYSKSENVKIVNCTKGSMIDSYEKSYEK
jgi:hypothetical protein